MDAREEMKLDESSQLDPYFAWVLEKGGIIDMFDGINDSSLFLPKGITFDMLPTDCPGWGRYNMNSHDCALCDYNIDCMCSAEGK